MEFTIKTAGAKERDACISTLALAFSSDPAARWAWPDAHTYFTNFGAFARAFGGAAFEKGSAHYVDGHRGAALWLPPGSHPDEEALGALIESTTSGELRADVFAIFEQMAAYHPREPHWHLPLIGVDPAQQGKGYGGALLRHALEACDREGIHAYLEATSPSNRRLYERYGFETVATIQVGTSPTVCPMVRKPR